MKGYLFLYVTLLCVTCHIIQGAPNPRFRRDANDQTEKDISPINSEDEAADGLNREKRKLVEPVLQSKNAILGFVFGASKASAAKVIAGSSSSSNHRPTKQPTKTTTDDTPDFDRNKVSLQVPDELFGNSFTLVTNVSKLMGDFIMNSARRTADFFWVLQPLLKKSLTIENPPPTTTTTETNEV